MNFLIKKSKHSIKFLGFLGFLLYSPLLFSQTYSVSGNVKTTDKTPLQGVTIGSESSSVTTLTDQEGNFQLQVNSESSVLIFSKEGYLNEKITWNGETPVTIVLITDLSDLSQNALLKKLLESSPGIYPVDYPGFPEEDPLKALQGRIPGILAASHSGAPGEGTFINIRGINTFLFNHDPVILIDGVPSLTTTDINYFDVDQINIVNDIATSSLYGSNGANGVVLISTKRGMPGQNSVDFNATFGVYSPPDFINLLNGEQAFSYIQELNQPLEGTPEDKSIYWGEEPFSSGEMININDLKNIDWQNELFRSAIQQNYSLGFSGGTEDTRFHVSGSYFTREGIVEPSDYSRITFSFNLDKIVSKRLSFNTGFIYAKSRKNVVNTNSSAEGGGVILSALASPPFLPEVDSSGEYFINPLRPEINNVLANMNGITDEINSNEIITRFFAKYKIINGLSLQLYGASNISFTRENGFMSTKDVYIGRQTSGLGLHGGYEYINYDFKGFLNYEKTIKTHGLSLMGGGGIFGSRYSWNEGLGTGYTNDDITLVGNAPNQTAQSNINNYTRKSVISSLGYNYDKKYYIKLNLRSDGTSRFTNNLEVISDPVKPEVWEIQKDEKWGISYGLSLAWNMSAESFLKDNSLISNLWIRASYGKTGNDGGLNTGRIYPYYWNSPIGGFNPDEDYVEKLFPVVGFDIQNLQNLFWETTSEMNAEIDIGILKDRINLSACYFSRKSVDLIMPVLTDSTFNNTGQLSRSGFELSLETLNFSTSNFKWLTWLNFTFLKNEVLQIDNSYDALEIGFNGNSNVLKTGEPVFAFWGLQTDGIFQTQDEVDNHATQTGAGPGDIRYVNQNSDNIIDENDRVVIGNPNPDFLLGFNNVFEFMNFEISVYFYGALGQDILNLTRLQTEGLNDWINQSAEALNRWTGEGTSDDIPRAYPGVNNTYLSDRFIENGSYIRLKNLTICYNIPFKTTGRKIIKQLKIYLTAQNLLTITGYTGYDPEVSSFGPLNIDYGAYPNTRYLGGGISIGL